MKTNRSTKECAEYNLENQEAISCGLMETWEPDDKALAQEAKEAAEKAAGVKRFNSAFGLLKSIYAALPADVQSAYANPEKEKGIVAEYNGWLFDGMSVDSATVAIKSYTGNNSWHSHHQYYRLEVGSYGDIKRVKLNAELTINEKQLAKCVEAIVEKHHEAVAKWERRSQEQMAAKRRDAFVKANPDFASTFGISSCDIKVAQDGMVTIKYETFSLEQWRQIAILCASQTAAMKSLKESFKTNLPKA